MVAFRVGEPDDGMLGAIFGSATGWQIRGYARCRYHRRGGDRLAENRVFIDMLHFLNMQGPDVLAQLEVRARQAFSCGMQRLSASEKGRKPCRSPINWLAHFPLRPDAPHARPLWTR